MNTLNGMSSPGANGTIKYGCSQHRWHTKQRWAQTSKALWRAPFQNRPIWFLLWEGNQVARVQLVTRELQGMATMHRQNVFAACRNAARGIQFGMPALGIGTSQGVAWLCQRCVMQGSMVKYHLWMCSHRTYSSNKPVLCVLLTVELQQCRAQQGPETQPKELGKYLRLSTNKTVSHSSCTARSARTRLLKSCPVLLSLSPLSHCSDCSVDKPH